MKVQTMLEIRKEWRAEGRTYTPQDLTNEYRRQNREVLRLHESQVLVDAEQPDATAHTRELAELIREHRACGQYTTQG